MFLLQNMNIITGRASKELAQNEGKVKERSGRTRKDEYHFEKVAAPGHHFLHEFVNFVLPLVTGLANLFPFGTEVSRRVYGFT